MPVGQLVIRDSILAADEVVSCLAVAISPVVGSDSRGLSE